MMADGVLYNLRGAKGAEVKLKESPGRPPFQRSTEEANRVHKSAITSPCTLGPSDTRPPVSGLQIATWKKNQKGAVSCLCQHPLVIQNTPAGLPSYAVSTASGCLPPLPPRHDRHATYAQDLFLGMMHRWALITRNLFLSNVYLHTHNWTDLCAGSTAATIAATV